MKKIEGLHKKRRKQQHKKRQEPFFAFWEKFVGKRAFLSEQNSKGKTRILKLQSPAKIVRLTR